METSNELMIFGGVIPYSDNYLERRNKLITEFGSTIVFKNEYFVLFTMIKDFPIVKFTVDYLDLFLKTNRGNFSKSKHIDLARYRVSDLDPYIEFSNSCIEIFNECLKSNVDMADYIRAINMHKMQYLSEESLAILEESAVVLTEGVTNRGKTIAGYEDMRANLKNRFLKLDNLTQKSDRKGIINLRTMQDEDGDLSDGKIQLVTTFGIEELDKHMNIYEGDMVSLLAPAKGCKTRFTAYVLHNAVVNHKQNIVVWPIENGYLGWEALVRARHFNWLYNSSNPNAKNLRFVNDDMVRKGDMDADLANQELASWVDLRNNENYGTISLIDEDFDVDTFIEILDEAVTSANAKLVCIDYLQLISGGSKGNVAKNERIGDAYKKLLQYLKRKKIAAILPAQLKQSSLGDLGRTEAHEFINKDLRDAAGESYEVIKTPDINLALYGTPEDIRNGEMKLISVPSRNYAPFEPIDLYCDAGSCTFASVVKGKGGMR